jgi:hypothetical protein
MLQGITKAVASDPAAYDLLEEDPGACMCRLDSADSAAASAVVSAASPFLEKSPVL